MKSRIWWRMLLAAMGVAAVVVCVWLAWVHRFGKIHRHCIKIASLALRAYSDRHEGAFPCHTKGFGDALLLLVKEGCVPNVACLCGPDDDGHVLNAALLNDLDVPEAQCSRIYVQGLSTTNDPQICLLFDRRSVPGGDHFYGQGPPIREVSLLHGGMERISDGEWVEFSRRQVQLLQAAGWTREKAQEYYPEGK